MLYFIVSGFNGGIIMSLAQRIKRIFRNFSIPNIMTYIAATMAVILIGDMVSGFQISMLLSFSRDSILSGQIWRVISFLGIPDNYDHIWAIIAIVFYYSIGRDIEAVWGSRNLTAYLLTGYILTVIAGFIGGYTANTYLYMSLFMAYAALMPNNIFMVFFIIPVKAKYLAMLDAVFMLWTLIFGSLSLRLSVIAALAVFLIFFGEDLFRPVLNKWRHRDFIHEMKRNKIKITKHKED